MISGWQFLTITVLLNISVDSPNKMQSKMHVGQRGGINQLSTVREWLEAVREGWKWAGLIGIHWKTGCVSTLQNVRRKRRDRCSKMAQMDYRHRHEVARIHWDISRIHILETKGKCCDHKLGKKWLRVMMASCFGITVHKPIKIWQTSHSTYWQVEMYDYDIAVTGDARVAEKEKEKIETYQDLS